MATHDYVIANGTGAAVRSDLNNALAAIVSNNSSSTEPGTTYAYQWWADTNENVLKIRNSSNDGWITLRELDGTMLIEDGSASTPGLAFADDVNTGIFSGGADEIGLATGGAERLKISTSEAVFNDPSNDIDFRVESNGNTHMLFVDAGNDRVGIGASSPQNMLHLNGSDPAIRLSDTGANGSAFSIIEDNNGLLKFRNDASNAGTGSGIAFEVDASERARIDASGRLLVGTSSSSASTAAVFQGNSFSSGQANQVYFQRDTAGTGLSAGDGIGFLLFADNAGNVFSQIGCQADATTGSSDYPGRLAFYTTADGASSPTERLRIDSSGNVGISTTTTSGANLVIATNSNGGSGIKLIGKSANGGAEIDFRNNADSTLNGFIEFNDNGGILSTVVNQPQVFRTNNTERMRIDSSGVVQIGTTTGTGKLNVASTGDAALDLIADSDNNGSNQWPIINFRRNSATGTPAARIYQVESSGGLVFDNNGAERLRIDGSGNVFINRTTQRSAEKFSVDNGGQVAIFACTANADHSNIQMIHAYASGGTNATQFSFQNNTATQVGSIKSNGSSTSFNTSSDYRLKENVVDLDGAITRVKQLSPKRFNFIVNPETTVDGFLAHEAQTVVPEAITGTHNEVDDDNNPVYQGIDQSKLVPLLTAALQEAIAKIETLETKVAALEAG